MNSPGTVRAGTARGGRRKFRDYLRGLSPGARLSWLAGEECGELLKSGALKRDQVQAEIDRIGKAQKGVAKIVPSPCRLQDWRDGEQFPPPGKLMRRARRVLNPVEEPVAWPVPFLVGTATYDVICYDDLRRRRSLDMDGGPASASAAGIRALEDRGGRIEYRVDLKAEAQEDMAEYAKLVGAEELSRLRVAFS